MLADPGGGSFIDTFVQGSDTKAHSFFFFHEKNNQFILQDREKA